MPTVTLPIQKLVWARIYTYKLHKIFFQLEISQSGEKHSWSKQILLNSPYPDK